MKEFIYEVWVESDWLPLHFRETKVIQAVTVFQALQEAREKLPESNDLGRWKIVNFKQVV